MLSGFLTKRKYLLAPPIRNLRYKLPAVLAERRRRIYQ
jgi:hypothetical protein